MAASTQRSALGYACLKVGASLIRVLALPQHIEIRNQFKNLPASVTRIRTSVPSRSKGRTIVVDRYSPVQTDSTHRLPVHLNFHGSGYVIPSLGTDAAFCGRVAADTHCVVFDCSYRVAPEYPFPCALEDAEDVARFILTQTDTYNVKQLTLSGFSAGANIAMSLATFLGPDIVRGCCGFYGNYDLSKEYDAPESKSQEGVNIPSPVRRFFYTCLIPPGVDRQQSLLSPINADLKRFPSHIFLACGRADALHESSRLLVTKLHDGGHSAAEFIDLPQAAHAFDKRTKSGSPLEAEKQRMYQSAIDTILRCR